MSTTFMRLERMLPVLATVMVAACAAPTITEERAATNARLARRTAITGCADDEQCLSTTPVPVECELDRWCSSCDRSMPACDPLPDCSRFGAPRCDDPIGIDDPIEERDGGTTEPEPSWPLDG